MARSRKMADAHVQFSALGTKKLISEAAEVGHALSTLGKKDVINKAMIENVQAITKQLGLYHEMIKQVSGGTSRLSASQVKSGLGEATAIKSLKKQLSEYRDYTTSLKQVNSNREKELKRMAVMGRAYTSPKDAHVGRAAQFAVTGGSQAGRNRLLINKGEFDKARDRTQAGTAGARNYRNPLTNSIINQRSGIASGDIQDNSRFSRQQDANRVHAAFSMERQGAAIRAKDRANEFISSRRDAVTSNSPLLMSATQEANKIQRARVGQVGKTVHSGLAIESASRADSGQDNKSFDKHMESFKSLPSITASSSSKSLNDYANSVDTLSKSFNRFKGEGVKLIVKDMNALSEAARLAARETDDLARISKIPKLSPEGLSSMRGRIADAEGGEARVEQMTARQVGRDLLRADPREAMGRRLEDIRKTGSELNLPQSDIDAEISIEAKALAETIQELAKDVRDSHIDAAIAKLADDLHSNKISKTQFAAGVVQHEATRAGDEKINKELTASREKSNVRQMVGDRIRSVDASDGTDEEKDRLIAKSASGFAASIQEQAREVREADVSEHLSDLSRQFDAGAISAKFYAKSVAVAGEFITNTRRLEGEQAARDIEAGPEEMMRRRIGETNEMGFSTDVRNKEIAKASADVAAKIRELASKLGDTSIDAAITKLAEDYDDGKITAKEFESAVNRNETSRRDRHDINDRMSANDRTANPVRNLGDRISTIDSSGASPEFKNKLIAEAGSEFANTIKAKAKDVREADIDGALAVLARKLKAGGISTREFAKSAAVAEAMKSESGNVASRQAARDSVPDDPAEMMRARMTAIDGNPNVTGIDRNMEISAAASEVAENIRRLAQNIRESKLDEAIAQLAEKLENGKITGTDFARDVAGLNAEKRGAGKAKDTIAEAGLRAKTGHGSETLSLKGEAGAIKARIKEIENEEKATTGLTKAKKDALKTEREALDIEAKLLDSQVDLSSKIDNQETKIKKLLTTRNKLTTTVTTNTKDQKANAKAIHATDDEIKREVKHLQELKIAQAGANNNQAHAAKLSGNYNFRIQQLSYGVQDFVQVIGQTGLSGALRASANNLAAFSSAFGTTSAAIGGSLITIAMIGVAEAITHLGTKAETSEEKIERLTKSIEKFIDVRQQAYDFSGDLVGTPIGEADFSVGVGNDARDKMESSILEYEKEGVTRAAKMKAELKDKYEGWFDQTSVGLFDGVGRVAREKVGGTDKSAKAEFDAFKQLLLGPDPDNNPKSNVTYRPVGGIDATPDEELAARQKLISDIQSQILDQNPDTAEGLAAISEFAGVNAEYARESAAKMLEINQNIDRFEAESKLAFDRTVKSLNAAADNIEGVAAFGDMATVESAMGDIVSSARKSKGRLDRHENQLDDMSIPKGEIKDAAEEARLTPKARELRALYAAEKKVYEEHIKTIRRLYMATDGAATNMSSIGRSLFDTLQESDERRRVARNVFEEGSAELKESDERESARTSATVNSNTMSFDGSVQRQLFETQDAADARAVAELQAQIAELRRGDRDNAGEIISSLMIRIEKIMSKDTGNGTVSSIEGLHTQIQNSLQGPTKEIDLLGKIEEHTGRIANAANQPVPVAGPANVGGGQWSVPPEPIPNTRVETPKVPVAPTPVTQETYSAPAPVNPGVSPAPPVPEDALIETPVSEFRRRNAPVKPGVPPAPPVPEDSLTPEQKAIIRDLLARPQSVPSAPPMPFSLPDIPKPEMSPVEELTQEQKGVVDETVVRPAAHRIVANVTSDPNLAELKAGQKRMDQSRVEREINKGTRLQAHSEKRVEAARALLKRNKKRLGVEDFDGENMTPPFGAQKDIHKRNMEERSPKYFNYGDAGMPKAERPTKNSKPIGFDRPRGGVVADFSPAYKQNRMAPESMNPAVPENESVEDQIKRKTAERRAEFDVTTAGSGVADRRKEFGAPAVPGPVSKLPQVETKSEGTGIVSSRNIGAIASKGGGISGNAAHQRASLDSESQGGIAPVENTRFAQKGQKTLDREAASWAAVDERKAEKEKVADFVASQDATKPVDSGPTRNRREAAKDNMRDRMKAKIAGDRERGSRGKDIIAKKEAEVAKIKADKEKAKQARIDDRKDGFADNLDPGGEIGARRRKHMASNRSSPFDPATMATGLKDALPKMDIELNLPGFRGDIMPELRGGMDMTKVLDSVGLAPAMAASNVNTGSTRQDNMSAEESVKYNKQTADATMALLKHFQSKERRPGGDDLRIN